jgi:molybdopterin/thiamine biosynthesis adenylyltransferase
MKVESMTPVIDVGFWQKAYYLKLETLKLSEDPIRIFGISKCSKFNDGRMLVNLEASSFGNLEVGLVPHTYHEVRVPGILQIINTESKLEEFYSKADQTCLKFMELHPEQIPAFFMVLYINHKTFEFSYSVFQTRSVKSYTSHLKSEPANEETEVVIDYAAATQTGGLLLGRKDGIPILCDTTSEKVVSSFAIDFAIRDNGKGFFATRSPVVLKEAGLPVPVSLKRFHLAGLEDAKKEDGPLIYLKSLQKQEKLNLKPFLSKNQLVEDQSLLNLKLMKWRLEPLLDLEKLFSRKVLILGSGTLGCNIGRLLTGYGIRRITFVDNGNVSFSNLARQSLFSTNSFNSEGKGFPKAEAAKLGLQLVAPHLEVEAVNLTIPMPGHFVTDDRLEEVIGDLQKLEDLIREHDIVFNVFDSREARYFPSLLGALLNKNVISIGIGYDSFVIVQHGNYGKEKCASLIEDVSPTGVDDWNKETPFGCFFCSDYLPPSDSMSNRTMDQQCTVSRPGISMIASGLAMEMLVNNLHGGQIGKSSHFIRGAAGNSFEMVEYENSRFENCVACSVNVITEYLRDKSSFLQNVLNNPNIISKYTGFDVDGGNAVLIGEDADDDGIIVIDLLEKFALNSNASEKQQTDE